MKRTPLLLVVLLFASGCASAVLENRSEVRPGMSRADVLDRLGAPDGRRVEVIRDIEFEWAEWESSYGFESYPSFCVLFQDGQVNAAQSSAWCGPPGSQPPPPTAEELAYRAHMLQLQQQANQNTIQTLQGLQQSWNPPKPPQTNCHSVVNSTWGTVDTTCQ